MAEDTMNRDGYARSEPGADAPGPGFRGGPQAGGGEPDWSFLPEEGQGLRAGFDSPDSFWTALGRPEKAEGYALPEKWNGEGISSEVSEKVSSLLNGDREAFMRVCHACNLTGKQAESLFGVVGGLMAESVGQEEASRNTDPHELVNSVWPKETQKHLDAARRGAHYAGLGDALDEAGLSTNPLVLNLARALGEAVGESSAPGGKGWGAGLPVGERAMEEMYRMIATDAYRSNDPEAIRKVEALARRVDMG